MSLHMNHWIEHGLVATARFIGENLELKEIVTDFKSKISQNQITFRETIEDLSKLIGAYIPLVMDHEQMMVGIFSDEPGCQALTRRFLKLENNESDLSREDIADAFKEIANIISGVLNCQVHSDCKGIQRGLPVFMEGFIRASMDEESGCAAFRMRGNDYYLVMIRSRIELAEKPVEVSNQQALKSIQDWFGETMTATFKFAVESLGVSSYNVKRVTDKLFEEEVAGAYLPLVGDKDVILVGLLVGRQNLLKLARMFLKLSDDEVVTELDAADAVKEMLNILSGLIKQQMFKHHFNLKRGLPVFIDGCIELTNNEEYSTAMINIGKIKLYLMLIRKSQTPTPC